MEIDTLEVMEDHVHLFLSAPPRYAPARIVQILKSISARELFARFPRLRRQLWGGQLWEDGYFVRSVGDAVTAEIIRRYIRYQKSPQNIQLNFCLLKVPKSPAACCGDLYLDFFEEIRPEDIKVLVVGVRIE